MILRRIGEAIRRRDWAAVVIEFAIVVLGIVVALQAEDWNQERNNRQLERVYLDRLADETRANLEVLRQHRQIYEDKVRFVDTLPDMTLEQAFARDPQAFMYQLDYSSYIALPNLRAETYQELESSGRLALIRDAELRRAVASNLNDYRSTQAVFIEPIGEYRRMLFETLPGRAYYEYRVGTGVTDAAAVIAAVESFRSNPGFAAAANAEMTYGADVLFYLRDFIERSEAILARLDAGDQGRPRSN